MNKAQLVEWLQQSSELGDMTTKAAAERALTAVIKGLEHGLKKEKSVSLVGFGSFSVRKRGARMGRNPRTGEAMKIKASKTVSFKAGKALKDKIK